MAVSNIPKPKPNRYVDKSDAQTFTVNLGDYFDYNPTTQFQPFILLTAYGAWWFAQRFNEVDIQRLAGSDTLTASVSSDRKTITFNINNVAYGGITII